MLLQNAFDPTAVQTPGIVHNVESASTVKLKQTRGSRTVQQKKQFMKQFDAAKQKARAFASTVDPERLKEIETDLGVSRVRCTLYIIR